MVFKMNRWTVNKNVVGFLSPAPVTSKIGRDYALREKEKEYTSTPYIQASIDRERERETVMKEDGEIRDNKTYERLLKQRASESSEFTEEEEDRMQKLLGLETQRFNTLKRQIILERYDQKMKELMQGKNPPPTQPVSTIKSANQTKSEVAELPVAAPTVENTTISSQAESSISNESRLQRSRAGRHGGSRRPYIPPAAAKVEMITPEQAMGRNPEL